MMFDWRALREPNRARKWLSHRLLRGRVTLVVGAGVSMPAGLPSWRTLLERTANDAKMTPSEVQTLLTTMTYYDVAEKIRGKLGDEDALARSVRAALYDGVEYGIDTIRTPTLIAIGSWLRRDLGGVRTLITLNFDDLVEWYCATVGIDARGSGVPTAPVGAMTTILHPHGFLPRPAQAAEGRVVFSRSLAETHLGAHGREWMTVIERVFAQTACVFYGMSSDTANDWTFSPLLRSAHEAKDHGLVGFWLFGSPVSTDVEERLEGMGVVPLVFNGHAESALFMLSVASSAFRSGELA